MLARNQRGPRVECEDERLVETELLLNRHTVPEGADHGTFGEKAGAIRHHHYMIGCRMGEIEEESLLLHQPQDKFEIGLAVLCAVFQRYVAALCLQLRYDAVRREDRMQNLENRFVLKDAGLLVERQQPE